jgi:hypothetical protein
VDANPVWAAQQHSARCFAVAMFLFVLLYFCETAGFWKRSEGFPLGWKLLQCLFKTFVVKQSQQAV